MLLAIAGSVSESESKEGNEMKIKLYSLAAAAAATDGVEEPFAPKSRVDLPLHCRCSGRW